MTYITSHVESVDQRGADGTERAISSSPTNNFCSLDLLKEDWKTREESESVSWGANNPPGMRDGRKKPSLAFFLPAWH